MALAALAAEPIILAPHIPAPAQVDAKRAQDTLIIERVGTL
jgi:hypothetical protein